MKRESTTIKIKDRECGQFVEAMLYKGIMEKNVDDYTKLWLPQFGISKLQGMKIEDAHWNWGRKMQEVNRLLIYNSYVIEKDDITQAMMITTDTINLSKLEPSKPLLYIEYLSVAPWNRGKLVTVPKYALLGRIMFMQAVIDSYNLDYEGRVGLHSLPGAESWYKDELGLIEIEDNKKLKYFELSKERAKIIITEFEK